MLLNNLFRKFMSNCCKNKIRDFTTEKKDRRMQILVATTIVVVVGGIIAGILSSRGGAAVDEVGTPKIVIEPEEFDFGDVSMANGKVSQTFKIKNEGDADLKLSNIHTSCMCTTATLKVNGKKSPAFGMQGHGATAAFWRETLKPGETADLDVVFDPNAHGPDATGPITRAIYLHSNDGGKEDVQSTIMFTANVIH